MLVVKHKVGSGDNVMHFGGEHCFMLGEIMALTPKLRKSGSCLLLHSVQC